MTDPDTEPQARMINPSALDKVRRQEWPRDFRDELLERRVRLDGSHWLLHRNHGRTTRANKIRLRADGRILMIGRSVPHAERMISELVSVLPTEYEDSSEHAFRLEPSSATSLPALRLTRVAGGVSP